MSAGTCLLCGKSLARIRVGAGGDFCSREHRSQYRLRRVMDCLAEGNKVATLARRRENPKPLFGEASPGSSSARREFPEAAPFRLAAGLKPGVRRLRKADRAALLARAGILAEPVPSVAPREARREFGIKTAASGRVAIPHGPPGGRKGASMAGTQARGLRAIAAFAAPGNAVRVSSSAGFRLRAPDPHKFTYAARQEPGGIARVAARAGTRLFTGPPAYLGMPAEGRLAFVDMGFPAAPDAPARLDWIGANGAAHAGRKGREL